MTNIAMLDIDPAKVVAAAHQALRKTMPDRYTPELADEIAADINARLQARLQKTAAERAEAQA